MEQDFITILQKLVNEQGKEALLTTAKCKAFLADYTRGEHKKESQRVLKAIEYGAAKAINDTDELDICKKQQIRLLKEDYFLSAEIASDIVDALAFVLRGDTSKSEIEMPTATPLKEKKKNENSNVYEGDTVNGEPYGNNAKIFGGTTPGIAPLLDRASIFLEDGDFKSANEYYDRVLDLEPRNARAYFGKLLASFKYKKEDDILLQEKPLDDNSYYQKAVRFADDAYKQKLEGYNLAIIKRISDEAEREKNRLAKYTKIVVISGAY